MLLFDYKGELMLLIDEREAACNTTAMYVGRINNSINKMHLISQLES